MATPLLLTLIGDDRPGLVAALSNVIAGHGGAWLESRLAHLAGKFAGIVLVSVDDAAAEGLIGALRDLDAAGLHVEAARGSAASTPGPSRLLTMSILGNDRPGIVRDVTDALTRLGVNIEEFESAIESAPFTGAPMFRASATLRAPEAVADQALRQPLERLAGEIMVDFQSK